MVVEFSKAFVKSLKKHYSKLQAKGLLKRLAKTSASDGDFVALVKNVVVREKREVTFRFYFITQNGVRHVVTKKELDALFVTFVALSKKNDQQHVIDKLKLDLQSCGYKIDK